MMIRVFRVPSDLETYSRTSGCFLKYLEGVSFKKKKKK